MIAYNVCSHNTDPKKLKSATGHKNNGFGTEKSQASLKSANGIS
jgi:hypothetical protein